MDDLIKFGEKLPKETPKENQVTEYKIKRFLVIKEFISILSKIDNSLSVKSRKGSLRNSAGTNSVAKSIPEPKREADQ